MLHNISLQSCPFNRERRASIIVNHSISFPMTSSVDSHFYTLRRLNCAHSYPEWFSFQCHKSSFCITCPCLQVHLAGQQKMFNIFSLRSGGTYLVQVRCKPDHGFWSEWSSLSRVQVPECKLFTAITVIVIIITFSVN